ncbi:MAG: hypothetical protein QOJ89_5144, partial [bacterium]
MTWVSAARPAPEAAADGELAARRAAERALVRRPEAVVARLGRERFLAPDELERLDADDARLVDADARFVDADARFVDADARFVDADARFVPALRDAEDRDFAAEPELERLVLRDFVREDPLDLAAGFEREPELLAVDRLPVDDLLDLGCGMCSLPPVKDAARLPHRGVPSRRPSGRRRLFEAGRPVRAIATVALGAVEGLVGPG